MKIIMFYMTYILCHNNYMIIFMDKCSVCEEA